MIFSSNGVALIVQTGPAGSNASSVSPYLVEDGGTLSPVTGGVPTVGSFACWIALTPNGQFAYVSNSLSSTISGFAIGSSGGVTALPGTVVASLPTGSTNLDIAVSQDNKYVYTLNSGTGTIGILQCSQMEAYGSRVWLPVSKLRRDLKLSPLSKNSSESRTVRP